MCGTKPPFANVAIADAENLCSCGVKNMALQRISLNQTFVGADLDRLQTALSLPPDPTVVTRNKVAIQLQKTRTGGNPNAVVDAVIRELQRVSEMPKFYPNSKLSVSNEKTDFDLFVCRWSNGLRQPNTPRKNV
ncbi:hypothetical protein [Ruegeria lacuscaerulensis]|uniref:hypothetical protein n=1 Tax=Ruegeria lacuscaerulensis TaxID=55218 RepID=UPI001480A076|nr:hypothetical protein [Ruegeria lacuscaerulensis]